MGAGKMFWKAFLFFLIVPFFLFGQASSGSEPKGAVSQVAGSPSGAAPRIEFLTKTHDFGKVPEGPKVKTLFRFKNTGKGVLKIQDVRASCGCTAAAADGATEIPPGGTGAIKAEYDTEGRPGRAVKTITVTTNDPQNPTVTLQITAEVIRDIDIQPPNAYFYNLKKGESRAVTLKVLGKENLKFTVKSVASRDGKIQLNWEKLTEGNRIGAQLTASVKGENYGPIDDEIIVQTTYAKKPEIRIPVRGEVIGRVQVFPREIQFGTSLDQPVTLQVFADPSIGFHIRRVDTENGNIRPWVVKQPQPNGTVIYGVVVKPKKTLSPGPYEDTVILYTNDDEQPEVRVKVHGQVPASG